jgi:hypothetical protein
MSTEQRKPFDGRSNQPSYTGDAPDRPSVRTEDQRRVRNGPSCWYQINLANDEIEQSGAGPLSATAHHP